MFFILFQVDARLLRAVAIEHPKDADAAAEVVLTEILPYMSYSAYMDFAASADKSCSDAKDGEGIVRFIILYFVFRIEIMFLIYRFLA